MRSARLNIAKPTSGATRMTSALSRRISATTRPPRFLCAARHTNHQPERGIGHSEAGAHALPANRDCVPVRNRIGLRQVLHGLDQQPLSVHVARIRRAFARLFSADIWGDWNRENLSHGAPKLGPEVGIRGSVLEWWFEYNA